MALSPGTRLGPYEILGPLGAGGMGEVYRAWDTRLDRDVAIKVLPPSFASDADRRARFEREAKAIAALSHPNILAIHDTGAGGGEIYVVTELLDGRTVRDELEKGALPIKKAIEIAVQIARGLAAAHEKGIVHRDLKLENVFLLKDGQVKILDFGLARSMATNTGATETVAVLTDPGVVMGTVGYMAPEQVRGEVTDARTDLFALGAVLYEMLTGRRAFQRNTAAETMTAILREDPPDLMTTRVDLSPGLERIVRHCLEKNPVERFQSARDVAFALEALSGTEVSSRPAPVPSQPQQGRRSWWTFGIAALVALTVAAGVSIHFLASTASDSPPRVGPLTTLPGNEQQPSLSPDGTHVAFAWNGEGGDNVDIYIMPVGTGTPLRLTTDPEVDTGPTWSPDGSQIAFVRQAREGVSRRTIYLATPPLPNSEKKLADVQPPLGAFYSVTTLSWFPDSKRLMVEEADSGKTWIEMIPIDHGPSREVLSMPISDGTLHYPAVSTRGTMLAYAVCTSIFTCNLYVIDLMPDGTTKGHPRQLTRENSEILGLAWAADDRSLVYGSGAIATYALRRVSVTGGTSQVLEMAADHARTPAISRSTGARVAYARADFDMDIWQFQPNGAPSRSPLSSTLDDRNPQLSPDGTRLVFESRRLGKESQLWIGNADGTKVTQLTEGGRGIQGAPSWSPDGNWIAFDGTVSANRSGIWIVEATGGQPRLLSAPGIIPSWSRDGKWIYFTRGGPVWRIPAQGGDAQQVTENNGSNAVESPDGGTLYYSRGNAIFAKPSGGGRESHVMDMAGSALGGSTVHRWLPVDGGICYLTRPDWKMPFQFELRFMDLRSHRETVLQRFTGGNGAGLAASRDRKTIFYSGTTPSQGSDLMLIQDFR